MAKQSTPYIQCDHCLGSGKVKLADELAAVLRFVQKKPRSDAETVQTGLNLGVTSNAVSGRLLTLMAKGLVSREKQGRNWLYSATEVRA